MGKKQKVVDTRKPNQKATFPIKTIFMSDEPNRLGGIRGFKRYKNVAKLYNYSPILHDLWVFISTTKQQLRKIYQVEEDLPVGFQQLYEKDLDFLIEFIKQWQPRRLMSCECLDNDNDHFCEKCFAGKRGQDIHEFYNSYYKSDSSSLNS